MEKVGSALKWQGLKIIRPQWRLEIPDLTLDSGKVLVLDAPSGFGKTTFVKALLGSEPSQGEIFLGTLRLDRLPTPERQLGVVFQDQALFTHLNALDNVMAGLVLHGKSKREAQALSESALDRLGLSDRKMARVGELSGGERQRVAILRALIWKPQVWILDEPLQGLDEKTRELVLEYLTEWRRENQVPTLWVDHQTLPPRTWGEVIRLRGQTQDQSPNGFQSDVNGVAHTFELAR